MHVKSDMICFCLFVYFYSCKNNGVRAQGRGEGRGARDCCFWRIVVFFGWEELGAALMVLTAFWKRGWRGLLLYEGAAACFVCMHMCVWETGGQMCWQWLPFIPVLLLLHPARWITEKNAVWGSAAAYVCVCVRVYVCSSVRAGACTAQSVFSVYECEWNVFITDSSGKLVATEQQLQGAWAHTHTL